MPGQTGQVNWYGDQVRLVIAQASQAVLEQAAFTIEGAAKENIVANDQVDTGFMLNSAYTVLPGRSTYAAAKAAAEAQNPDATMAPEQSLPDGAGAAVSIGAAYAAYQEVQRPYLYPAVETAQRAVGGIVETVARDQNLKA